MATFLPQGSRIENRLAYIEAILDAKDGERERRYGTQWRQLAIMAINDIREELRD